MRDNQPVTQREYVLRDDATLMSTTDVQSHIEYANGAFVEASGFTREQLRGQPHNLVRHPDMPREAFADMWATLKGGEPWTGLVKNRRQNGDHYWVRANATPVVRDGKHLGYMSVRTKATREEVAAAEALYRDIREGRARDRAFHKGVIVRTDAMRWATALKTMSVRWRIRWAMLAMMPLVVGAAALAGVAGAVLASVGGAALAAAGLVAWFLEAQIAGPLEGLRDAALKVASGESRNAVHIDRVDESSSIEAAVCCRLDACSSVRWLRSALPVAICDEPVAMLSITPMMSAMRRELPLMSRMVSTICSTASLQRSATLLAPCAS